MGGGEEWERELAKVSFSDICGQRTWKRKLSWVSHLEPSAGPELSPTFPPSNYPQPSLKEIELSDANTTILRAATSFQDMPINGNRDKNPPLLSIHDSYPVNRVNNFRRLNILVLVGRYFVRTKYLRCATKKYAVSSYSMMRSLNREFITVFVVLHYKFQNLQNLLLYRVNIKISYN